MTDEPDPERLKALEERIAALRGGKEERPHQEESYSQAQHVWRMVVELVTGLLIGFGIGYGLDSVFGTMPLFLVLFMLLGFAAGVRVMLRTAAELQGNQAGRPAGTQEKQAGESAAAEDERD